MQFQETELPAIPEVSADELLRRLNDSRLRIVNVLSRDAFAAGHIPGSISLPLDEIEKSARNLLTDPSQEIAVYCGSPT